MCFGIFLPRVTHAFLLVIYSTCSIKSRLGSIVIDWYMRHWFELITSSKVCLLTLFLKAYPQLQLLSIHM